MACPTNLNREFVAVELAEEQTLENLYAFGDRLRQLHDTYLVPEGRCRCARGAKP